MSAARAGTSAPAKKAAGRARKQAAGGEKASSDEYSRTREAIIRAAAEVFSRDGFRAGTTKDIAARVGLSQPSLYYYVGSKDALLGELALRLDHDLQGTFERAREAGPEPRQQLKALIRELTVAVAKDRDLFAVYWAESRWLPKKIANQVRADEQAYVRDLEKLVAGVQSSGELNYGPPAVVTQGIIGMILWLYRWYKRPGDPNAEDLAEIFLAMIGLDDD